MELRDLQKNWDELGRVDPLWAILTDDAKRGAQWEHPQFFESGRAEVADLFAFMKDRGLTFGRRRALDFGCGVGRLSQALAPHFEHVVGVDVAPSMVAQARALNQHGDGCDYIVNGAPHLDCVAAGSIDFILSKVVLQHMRPELIRAYVTSFVRLLAPGGLAAFQLPSHYVPNEPDAAGSAADGPLPAAAFHATITALDAATVAPGSIHALPVTVRNASPIDWPATGHDDGRFRVQLGNHWAHADGRTIATDDQRVRLPHDVRAGESVTVELPVRAPSTPGRYRLELDMVQESVTWFANHGSPLHVVDVTVESTANTSEVAPTPRDDTTPPADATWKPPRIEMYGIRRPEAEQLIAEAGGVTKLVFEDYSAGEGWESWLYFVARA